MLYIKNAISIAALVCGLLIGTALSVSAAEVCRKNSLFPGITGPAMTISTDTPQCKTAKEAFDAAIVIVTGKPDYKFAMDNGNPAIPIPIGLTKSNLYVWVNDLANNPKYSAKFKEGLKFGDAVSFLKERIATNANDRAFAINNAFVEVYGRPANSVEQAQWDAKVREQKAWYSKIVASEIGKLNSSAAARTAMIDNVVQRTYGRTGEKKDYDKWLSGTTHYRLLMQEARNSLYSSDGAGELIQTLKVAYLAKYGIIPTDKQLSAARIKVSDDKMIFERMLNPNVSLK